MGRDVVLSHPIGACLEEASETAQPEVALAGLRRRSVSFDDRTASKIGMANRETLPPSTSADNMTRPLLRSSRAQFSRVRASRTTSTARRRPSPLISCDMKTSSICARSSIVASYQAGIVHITSIFCTVNSHEKYNYSPFFVQRSHAGEACASLDYSVAESYRWLLVQITVCGAPWKDWPPRNIIT